jgi:uncharacterized protein YndB with AHSA1/START domain
VAVVQTSFLVIADITGYTRYLSESELEHAQEVLQALISLLLESTRPPMKLAGLEGDAVFSYALPGQDPQGQTFVDLLEQTYFAFRRAIDLMVLNNTCQCNACINIGSLDLKFFVHYGAFAVQRLAGREELVGSDVIYIHRLLKNHIREQTGIIAYTAYTPAAIDRLGLNSLGLVSHSEEFENLGKVNLFVQEMSEAWEREKKRKRIEIPKDTIALTGQIELDLPPEKIWDYIAQTKYRNVLWGADRVEATDVKADGRLGEGSTFSCYHGGKTFNQLILEWKPFERFVAKSAMFRKVSGLVEFRLEPTESGTRVVFTMGALEGPALGRFAVKQAMKRMKMQHLSDMNAFKRAIEEDRALVG